MLLFVPLAAVFPLPGEGDAVFPTFEVLPPEAWPPAAVPAFGFEDEVPLAGDAVGVGVGVGDAVFWLPEVELPAPEFCAVAIPAMTVASARI